MQFIRVQGTAELEEALTGALNDALAKSRVLWLIPGGSNIPVAINVMKRLSIVNINHLTIALTDERYGPAGHEDSNFALLHKGGFTERGATFADILRTGSSLAETTQAAGIAMGNLMKKAETIIGFFGMGPDGHIAGILPDSPAAVLDEAWVIGYDAGQFKRMTLTPFALLRVQIAVVGAFGPEKLMALEMLHHSALPVSEQPAQILRKIPKAYIFNDQIGDLG